MEYDIEDIIAITCQGNIVCISCADLDNYGDEAVEIHEERDRQGDKVLICKECNKII